MTESALSPQSLGRAPKIWENVPSRNRNFTGREELLDRLRASISGEITAVVSRFQSGSEPHALHGLGGVGKTMLAVEYAHRYRSAYDLVWWIPSDQPVLVRSSLAGLAPHLGLPPATATGIEDAAKAVLNALRLGEPYSNWLLIFDNADEPEDIREVIPSEGPGHVLITSRNPRWDAEAQAIQIDVFKREESVEFLHKRVPRGAITEEEAAELAHELGHLPLALEQAGALQAQTGMPVEEYLQQLKERTAELLSEGKPTEYPASMTAAWGLSVASLKGRLPEAEELLRCCAFFSPEPIPRAAFNRASAGVSERLAALLRDPIELGRAIGELNRFALVRVDHAARTLQVHRLIQALVRSELTEAERTRYRNDVHRLLLAATPDAPDVTDNWPQYAGLLAHIVSSDMAMRSDPELRTLILKYVRYLYTSGDYRSAALIVEGLESNWEGGDDLALFEARRHHAIIVRELGRYPEAYELNQKTLTRMNRVFSEDPEFQDSYLSLVNSIGADLRARGDFRQARDHDEDSRQRNTERFGPEDSRTLRVLSNLAVDYGLVSDYPRSRELHNQVYQQVMKQGGAKAGQAFVVSSWGGLSRAVRLCGQYQIACDVGEEAYAHGVKELGADHPWTLRTTKDLSIALRRAGQYDRALEVARDLDARYVRLYGRAHPDSLASAMCLANILRTVGEVAEAYELAAETLRLYPDIYGPEHPYHYGCMGNLAILERVRDKNVERARQLNETALEGLEKKLERNHHYSLTVAVNLATDLAALGDLKSAINLGRGTLRRLRAVLGENHPATLACAANLSADLQKDGAEEEAAELFERTLDGYDGLLMGPDHPDIEAAMARRHLDLDFDPPPI